MNSHSLVKMDQSGIYSPYSGQEVSLTGRYLKISNLFPGFYQFYLKGTSLGNVSNYTQVNVEVCGHEAVRFRTINTAGIIKRYN